MEAFWFNRELESGKFDHLSKREIRDILTKRGLPPKDFLLSRIENISLATGDELDRLDSGMNLVCLPAKISRKFGRKTKPPALLKFWNRATQENAC